MSPAKHQGIFLINVKKDKLPVAGCKVTKGEVVDTPDTRVQVIRNGYLAIREMKMIELRHLKEKVKSVTKGKDCGILVDISSGIVTPEYLKIDPHIDLKSFHFLPGDKLVTYHNKSVKRRCKWVPKGFA